MARAKTKKTNANGKVLHCFIYRVCAVYVCLGDGGFVKEKRGFFGIGIEKGKTTYNYGTLYRTAQVFEADFIFMIGSKFKPQISDTMKSYRHIPLFQYKNFNDFYSNLPYDCRLVGVELDDKATLVSDYEHPQRACYLLGAEDNGLSKEALVKCHELIKIQGSRSLNVSVAGSIVLYDRIRRVL